MRHCDCGQPAVKKDGSGWFCLECERVVSRGLKKLDDHIAAQRGEVKEPMDLFADSVARDNQPKRIRSRGAYMAQYAARNYRKLREYQRAYNARWKAKRRELLGHLKPARSFNAFDSLSPAA